jgi:hypothetical protein
MKECALPALQEWEQFDGFALLLQRLGWTPTQKADGPDARSWAFDREGHSIWLVFDDMLGGSLKAEAPSVDIEAVAAKLESSAAM